MADCEKDAIARMSATRGFPTSGPYANSHWLLCRIAPTRSGSDVSARLFSRRFDTIASNELAGRVPQLLADFEATVASGNLQATMNTLPVDHAQQLDLVLLLAGMLLHRSHLRPRFVECVQAFTKGIGNGEGATLESLTVRYSAAYEHYYAPSSKGTRMSWKTI